MAVSPPRQAPHGGWQPAYRSRSNHGWPIPVQYRRRPVAPPFQSRVSYGPNFPAYYGSMPLPPSAVAQRGYPVRPSYIRHGFMPRPQFAPGYGTPAYPNRTMQHRQWNQKPGSSVVAPRGYSTRSYLRPGFMPRPQVAPGYGNSVHSRPAMRHRQWNQQPRFYGSPGMNRYPQARCLRLIDHACRLSIHRIGEGIGLDLDIPILGHHTIRFMFQHGGNA